MMKHCLIGIINYINMGQKQMDAKSKQLLENWKPNPFEPDIFVNAITQEQVQRHCIQISKDKQPIYQKRMQEHHISIARVLYLQTMQLKPQTNEKVIEVYTDRMLPLNPSIWSNYNTTLTILKGFRKLLTLYGYIRVQPYMIGMNEKGNIKLWINRSPVLNEVNSRAQSEEQMLADLIRIILNYDTQTGGLMAGCRTFNEAINNILLNTTSQKNNSFSQRVKPINKQKVNQESNNQKQQQSEKFVPKKTDQQWKHTSDPRKKQIIGQQPPNYLKNVHVVKIPKYIESYNSPEKQEQIKKSTIQRFTSESSLSYAHTFQGENAIKLSKPPTLQFNNSVPLNINENDQSNSIGWEKDRGQKLTISENHPQNFIKVPQQNKIKGLFSPQHHQIYQSDIYNSKLSLEKKVLWKKAQQNQQLNGRKSQLNKEMFQKKPTPNKVNELPPFIQKRQEKNQNFIVPQREKNGRLKVISPNPKPPMQMDRTRTVDFGGYQLNEDIWNPSPSTDKRTISFKNHKPKQEQSISSKHLLNSSNQSQSQKEQPKPQQQYQQKKVAKQELAKQLKNQFNLLLSQSELKEFKEKERKEVEVELDPKSKKELMIKQKVEKKKATFAQLKTEAMKILSDTSF